MNLYFNFRLCDWTQVNQSFNIVPINFPIVSGSYIVNGDIITGSSAPVTLDLIPNVFKIELNKEASNNWFISSSTNTTTASTAIISGSYSCQIDWSDNILWNSIGNEWETGVLCAVTFNNLSNARQLDANKPITIKPLGKNLGFNDSFILQDTVNYTTDSTGSLTVTLVPQYYKITYNGGYRNESYIILVPNVATANAKDCIVTSLNVAKVINLQNQSLYAYTAQSSDARYYLTGSTVLSASYALVAQTLLGSVQSASVAVSASYAQTASFALNGGGSGTTLTTGSTYPITSSVSLNSISASYAVTSSAANSITFVPASASLSQTASYVKNAVSSSYVAVANSALNLNNTFVNTGNGLTITDADGSVMGITGGGMEIIWNAASAVSPFSVSDVSNHTLAFIDGSGSYWTKNNITASAISASAVTASLKGTASWANNSLQSNTAVSSTTATFATSAGSSTSASYALTASFALNAGGSSGTTLFTGSTYQITSSWANNAVSASYFS